MGGTVTGGAKARETNIRKYGEDYYRNIGSMGGKASGTGGWYKNPEAAAIAGSKGGKISKRGKTKQPSAPTHQSLWQRIIRGVIK